MIRRTECRASWKPVRAGTVSVVNALGSGLADTEGLFDAVPARVCAGRLLQEEPATAVARDLVVRPGRRARVTCCGNLEWLETRDVFYPRGERARGRRIRDGPEAWQVGGPAERDRRSAASPTSRASRSRLSTVPVIGLQGLRPVPFALRVFVAAIRRRPRRDARRTGAAVPAIRRTSLRFRPVRRRQGHLGPVGTLSARSGQAPRRTRTGAVELRRTGRELPSRTADNLFWLGRNAERAVGDHAPGAQLGPAPGRRRSPERRPARHRSSAAPHFREGWHCPAGRRRAERRRPRRPGARARRVGVRCGPRVRIATHAARPRPHGIAQP